MSVFDSKYCIGFEIPPPTSPTPYFLILYSQILLLGFITKKVGITGNEVIAIKDHYRQVSIFYLSVEGLDKALAVLRSNSRRNVGARPVVVFITDGDWNTGGDPLPTVNQLKAERVRLYIYVYIMLKLLSFLSFCVGVSTLHWLTSATICFSIPVPFDQSAHLIL